MDGNSPNIGLFFLKGLIMYFQILKPWHLRLEYFGGLLINRETGKIYNINLQDAIFLLALQSGFSTIQSKEITKEFLKDEHLDFKEVVLSTYINYKVISPSEQRETISMNAFVKNLKFNWQYLYEEKILSAPIEATIYPTSSCQLNCKFCYYCDKRKIYTKDASPKSWKKIIDELYNAGVLYLSILGGEPTLYPNIDEILQYAEDLGFKTTITSNGVNIKNSTFEKIAYSKFITPAISLQSIDGVTNFELMGVESQPIIKTIKSFVAKGKIPRVNTVYTIQNEQEIYELIDFLEGLSIQEYGLSIYMSSSKNKFSHTFDECRQMNENILRYIKEKNYKLNYSMQGCLLYSAYPELKDPIHCEFDLFQYGCEAGKTKLEIMPNGDVYPCAAFDDKHFQFDSAFEKNVLDIWKNSTYLNQIRRTKNKDSKCQMCHYYNFCNGGCLAHNLKENNSLNAKGDSRCQILMNSNISTN